MKTKDTGKLGRQILAAVIGAGLFFGGMSAVTALRAQTGATSSSAAAVRGTQLDEAQLGNLLAAMGLQPKQVDKRFDFAFKAIHEKEEWELSMTAVLSRDGQSLWVMAWLDELPKSAADVPRTALLRLLAANDRMGNGKFFAYIATNRRFVLQRVVPNRDLTTADVRDILKDLGRSVVETYPYWSTANWSTPSSSPAAQGGLTGAGSAPSRTAIDQTSGSTLPR